MRPAREAHLSLHLWPHRLELGLSRTKESKPVLGVRAKEALGYPPDLEKMDGFQLTKWKLESLGPWTFRCRKGRYFLSKFEPESKKKKSSWTHLLNGASWHSSPPPQRPHHIILQCISFWVILQLNHLQHSTCGGKIRNSSNLLKLKYPVYYLSKE